MPPAAACCSPAIPIDSPCSELHLRPSITLPLSPLTPAACPPALCADERDGSVLPPEMFTRRQLAWMGALPPEEQARYARFLPALSRREAGSLGDDDVEEWFDIEQELYPSVPADAPLYNLRTAVPEIMECRWVRVRAGVWEGGGMGETDAGCWVLVAGWEAHSVHGGPLPGPATPPPSLSPPPTRPSACLPTRLPARRSDLFDRVRRLKESPEYAGMPMDQFLAEVMGVDAPEEEPPYPGVWMGGICTVSACLPCSPFPATHSLSIEPHRKPSLVSLSSAGARRIIRWRVRHVLSVGVKEGHPVSRGVKAWVYLRDLQREHGLTGAWGAHEMGGGVRGSHTHSCTRTGWLQRVSLAAGSIMSSRRSGM